MEDSTTAILTQISLLKDMLDQVNHEIEANIQVTREIESEIVRCEELESALAIRESGLTEVLYASRFELNGLLVNADSSRNSAENLENQMCSLRTKRDETIKRINEKHEGFVKQCFDFQRAIESNEELRALVTEKEFLEKEFSSLEKKNSTLKNSMQAFVEEILRDLHCFNYALQIEIDNGNQENQKLVKEIDDLKTTLLSSIIIEDEQWPK